MWSSTVGLVNGKHRYLTAETFGFKVNSNGQQLKRRQQWTIEPFPENTGPDGSISSAASVSSVQCPVNAAAATTTSNGNHLLGNGLSGLTSNNNSFQTAQMNSQQQDLEQALGGSGSTCIMTLSNGPHSSGLMRNAGGSNNGSDHSEASCDEEHENVAIRSHLNKYLAVDSFGNVTCDLDEKTENARFTITICSMSQGKSKDEHIFWAFKNVERGYYLGTTEDGMICCNAKMPKSRAELWHLHLLPARGASFFALKSLGRKRSARVCSDQVYEPSWTSTSSSSSSPNNPTQTIVNKSAKSQVQLDANISWGPETLFQFKYFDGGRYALLTSDNNYLTNEGKCLTLDEGDRNDQQQPPNQCLFTLEYHSGYLAFRDSFGHYLAAAGRSSVLRSRSIGVSRDELFMFEPVPIQVSLKATFNNRWVSIKQGVDVSANQMETTSKYETFQLNYHKQTQLWSIMTQECNFWTISKSANTMCVCRPADYEALTRGQFKLIWNENEPTFSLKYVDHIAATQQQQNLERWILARKSGQLYAASGGSGPAGESVKFIMRFQNRRLLNLRPVDGSGFVGLKSCLGSKQLEANKTSPESIRIEYSESSSASISTSQQTNSNNGHINSASNKNNDSVLIEDNSSKVISMFNVKLNSTKKGQNIFSEEQQQMNEFNRKTAKIVSSQDNNNQSYNDQQQQQSQKQLDCLVIDSNNNEPEPEPELLEQQSYQDGGVESAAAPSVASIINTFSNVNLNHEQQNHHHQQHNHQQQQTTRQQVAAISTGLAVSKLASSFESANSNHQPQADQSSIESNGSANGTTNGVEMINGKSQLLADQVAQSEFCYMRLVTNGKYLSVVGQETSSNGLEPSSQGILCDSTNKACAQSWILELRSHNSIAIRASDTQAYMQLGTNGTIHLSRCHPKEASLWEF